MNDKPQQQNGGKYVTYRYVLGTLAGACATTLLLGASFANAYFYSKADGGILNSNYTHIKEDVNEVKEDVREVKEDIKEILKEIRRITP